MLVSRCPLDCFCCGREAEKDAGNRGAGSNACHAGSSRGISWGKDDTILFTSGGGSVLRVASSGGAVTEVTKLDISRQEGSHRWPQFLPDGRHFLYGLRSSLPRQSGIYAGSFDGPLKKLFVHTELSGSYVMPGFLLHTEGDMLSRKRLTPTVSSSSASRSLWQRASATRALATAPSPLRIREFWRTQALYCALASSSGMTAPGKRSVR